MTAVEKIFLWIGSRFHQELYLLFSKLQAICWSVADILLVLAVLKIADLARRREGLGRLTPLYFVLWGTALLTPLLIFAGRPRQIFLLESVICGCQFLILLYVVLTERKRVLRLFFSHKPFGTLPHRPEPVRNPETS